MWEIVIICGKLWLFVENCFQCFNSPNSSIHDPWGQLKFVKKDHNVNKFRQILETILNSSLIIAMLAFHQSAFPPTAANTTIIMIGRFDQSLKTNWLKINKLWNRKKENRRTERFASCCHISRAPVCKAYVTLA